MLAISPGAPVTEETALLALALLTSIMRTGAKQMAKLWGFILLREDWALTRDKWSMMWTKQFYRRRKKGKLGTYGPRNLIASIIPISEEKSSSDIKKNLLCLLLEDSPILRRRVWRFRPGHLGGRPPLHPRASGTGSWRTRAVEAREGTPSADLQDKEDKEEKERVNCS